MYTTLIEPAELASRTSDPNWAMLDCRFDLARPEWGEGAYTEGHLPNALYAQLDHDLSSATTPTSGRHPLPPKEAFAATLGGWGIDRKVQVVAYDQGNGMYASRAWWLLRWAGHVSVAVLNGGFAAWQQAGLPVSKQPGVRQPRRFIPGRARTGVASTADLLRILSSGQLASGERTLVDARSPDRFAGQNETLDPVAGHIPGAANYPWAHNLDARGRFLSAAALRAKWLETLHSREPSTVIAMCGSGVSACHNLLALEIAGLAGAQLYAGSWSEWIRDTARPVER